MWLSRKIAKNNLTEKAERGNVTISASDVMEADASANTRSLGSYAPYGYTSNVPVGEEVILVPSSDGQVALGAKCSRNNLESGEVMIASLGGAKILLRNDGTVVINSMVIDRNGVVQHDI